MLGYDFYTHVRHLVRDPNIEFAKEVGTTATYPALLHIVHFYAFYRATKAIG